MMEEPFFVNISLKRLLRKCRPDEEGVVLFALRDGDKWRSCGVPQSNLIEASYHLCDNGMILVVSPTQVQFFEETDLRPHEWTIGFSENYQSSVVVPHDNCVYFAGLSDDHDSHSGGNGSRLFLNVTRLTFENGQFTSRQFSHKVETTAGSVETADPSARPTGQRTNTRDLRNVPADPFTGRPIGPRYRGASQPQYNLTLVARPKGGIVIHVQGIGVFAVDDSNPHSETITKLDLPILVHGSANMIGCDIHDLVYFSLRPQEEPLQNARSEQSFIACAIAPHKMVPFTGVVESGRAFANPQADQFANTPEGLLFIASPSHEGPSRPAPHQTSSTDELLIWKPSKEEPYLLDDRLVGVDRLIPGRNGAAIAIYTDGRAALIQEAKVIACECSLGRLASRHFDLMLDLAPTNPCDTRYSNRVAFPLMSTGKTVWLNDTEGSLHRVTSSDRPAELIHTSGPTEMIGCLQDGTLLVRPRLSDGRSGRDLREWSWIEEPDKVDVLGERALPTLRKVESPPKESSGGILERPESFTGGWLTSNDGTIYLTQGFDRVYVISECEQWRMHVDFGSPLLEDTNDRIWAFRSARVYRGYQVADEEEGKRYTSIPSYLTRLTPVEQIGERMLCTTPLGLASFPIDLARENAKSITTHSRTVDWSSFSISIGSRLPHGIVDENPTVADRTANSGAEHPCPADFRWEADHPTCS